MDKVCYFCQKNINDIDFKNTELLRKFLSMQAKIASSKRTGTCKKHQRELGQAIKRARFMALLPYTTR
jgi:small subunit ribosomal protein S18